jgi:hypothetical protein
VKGGVRSKTPGPKPNLGFEMVYDTARQVTILEGKSLANPAPTGATLLFGGVRSGGPPYELLRDTWTWDGEHWHQRQDLRPSPRAGHALTWDAARNRGVLFGGVILVAAQETPAGDTWESFETP